MIIPTTPGVCTWIGEYSDGNKYGRVNCERWYWIFVVLRTYSKLPSTYSFSRTADVVITCLHSVPSGTMSHCSVANRYDPLIRSAIVVGFGAACYSHCQSSRCVWLKDVFVPTFNLYDINLCSSSFSLALRVAHSHVNPAIIQSPTLSPVHYIWFYASIRSTWSTGGLRYMRIRKNDFILISSTNSDRFKLIALPLTRIVCWTSLVTSSASLIRQIWEDKETLNTVFIYVFYLWFIKRRHCLVNWIFSLIIVCIFVLFHTGPENNFTNISIKLRLLMWLGSCIFIVKTYFV